MAKMRDFYGKNKIDLHVSFTTDTRDFVLGLAFLAGQSVVPVNYLPNLPPPLPPLHPSPFSTSSHLVKVSNASPLPSLDHK